MITNPTCSDCIHNKVCGNKDTFESTRNDLFKHMTEEDLKDLEENGFNIYVKCTNYSQEKTTYRPF